MIPLLSVICFALCCDGARIRYSFLGVGFLVKRSCRPGVVVPFVGDASVVPTGW